MIDVVIRINKFYFKTVRINDSVSACSLCDLNKYHECHYNCATEALSYMAEVDNLLVISYIRVNGIQDNKVS